jgi:hypothetical protein
VDNLKLAMEELISFRNRHWYDNVEDRAQDAIDAAILAYALREISVCPDCDMCTHVGERE